MSVLADTKHRIIPVMRYFFCILKARILIEGETDISYNDSVTFASNREVDILLSI